jgi:hypothetical protein
MVAAAAAILFGADPELQPGQVARLLAQTATPVADPGHRAGAGLLNVEAALARLRAGRIPPADYAEPNERSAAPLPRSRRVAATLDWRDDPSDRYTLRAGGRVTVRTHGSARGAVRVVSGGRVIATGPLGRPLALRLAGRRTATIEVTAAIESHGGYTLDVRT